MIAKSDLVILAVSSVALAVGVFRWQYNVSVPRIAAAPAASVSAPISSGAPRILADVLRDNEPSVSGNVPRSTDAGNTSVRRITPAASETSTVAVSEPDLDVQPADGRADSAVYGDVDNVNEPLYGVYEVQSGDYLSRIAEDYGTSVANLQAINGLDGDVILIGQALRYPLPAN